MLWLTHDETIGICRRISMVLIRARFLAFVAFFVAFVFQAGADAAPPSTWTQWHGPNRDGKSPETGLLKSWPEEGPKLLWKVSSGIGYGWSSVSIYDGLIYASGLRHEGTDYSEEAGNIWLSALDMDGNIKWSKDVGPAYVGNHVYQGSRATPTCDDGKVYLLRCLGILGCYDAKTGKTKWERNIRKDFKSHKVRWMFSESVLIIDDLVIATPGGTNSFMVALNKKSGETVWESGPFGGAHYTSPIYVEHEGIPMIINGGGSGIAGVHAETGKILWTNGFAAKNMANCPSPVFAEGHVFWAVGYGKNGICIKLSVDGDKVTATEAWRTKDIATQYGGYVYHEGYLYGNGGYKWACLDFKTGELMWKAEGVKKGSMCYADGMLYLYGIDKGHTMLVPATPKEFKPTGEFKARNRGKPARPHPVIEGGRLYLRYIEELYCYAIK
jgi:outer membrane protein assembly factor BamB